MAIVAGNYLMEHGYRIPEDIAVSGFDGIRMEKYCVPRLTTGIYNLEGFINTFFILLMRSYRKRTVRRTGRFTTKCSWEDPAAVTVSCRSTLPLNGTVKTGH